VVGGVVGRVGGATVAGASVGCAEVVGSVAGPLVGVGAGLAVAAGEGEGASGGAGARPRPLLQAAVTAATSTAAVRALSKRGARH
jgi:hypothetical protein